MRENKRVFLRYQSSIASSVSRLVFLCHISEPRIVSRSFKTQSHGRKVIIYRGEFDIRLALTAPFHSLMYKYKQMLKMGCVQMHIGW